MYSLCRLLSIVPDPFEDCVKALDCFLVLVLDHLALSEPLLPEPDRHCRGFLRQLQLIPSEADFALRCPFLIRIRKSHIVLALAPSLDSILRAVKKASDLLQCALEPAELFKFCFVYFLPRSCHLITADFNRFPTAIVYIFHKNIYLLSIVTHQRHVSCRVTTENILAYERNKQSHPSRLLHYISCVSWLRLL